MMYTLIQLSESEKRIIFAFLLLFILFLVLLSFIGSIITKILKEQGKKIDNAVYDVVITRVITDKKVFKRYARKKNWRLFLHDTKIALLILIAGASVLIVRGCFLGFDYNPFNMNDGFSSILFLWNFQDPNSYANFFGITLLAKWPPLINSPHAEVNAIPSYFAIPLILVGGIWYLLGVQRLIARTLHIISLSNSIFNKDLSNFNQNAQLFNTLLATNNEPNKETTH